MNGIEECEGNTQKYLLPFPDLKNVREGLLSTFFQKLPERMLRICNAVIKAGGGFIDENKIFNFFFIVKCLFLVKIIH